MKILIVDDEKRLARTVAKYLEEQGFTTDVCFDGNDALVFTAGTEYDVIVLDVMLPGRDGIAVLKALRGAGNETPVILLTAKDTVADKIRGLDSGADDYLTKPFALAELNARIRVLIRRQGSGTAGNLLMTGDLVLDMKKRVAAIRGEEIRFTAREFSILEFLLLNKGAVLSREKIEKHIWNYDYEGSSNIVDVYIRNLRNKLEKAAPGYGKRIETVRGMGYTIKE
ncbi:MAG: response regulator transcription factor [Clostridia bacterium]|nr:response regulator transcription factor [Clostridia bacterium]